MYSLRDQRGQTTVEWTGLVLLVAVAVSVWPPSAALYPLTTHDARPDVASLDVHAIELSGGTLPIGSFAPAVIPVITGGVGGTLSRLIVTG